MSHFAFTLVIILSVATILVAATALIIIAWRTGGMKHDILMFKRNIRKIAYQIRKDIKHAVHN